MLPYEAAKISTREKEYTPICQQRTGSGRVEENYLQTKQKDITEERRR